MLYHDLFSNLANDDPDDPEMESNSGYVAAEHFDDEGAYCFIFDFLFDPFFSIFFLFSHYLLLLLFSFKRKPFFRR